MTGARRLLWSGAVLSLLAGGGCGGLDDPGDEGDDPTLQREGADVIVDPNEPDPWSEATGTVGEEAPGRGTFSCSQVSGIANGNYTRLSYLGTAKLAHSAGVRCGYNLVKAVAVAGAESGRYKYAYLRNYNCSIDRGIWQINSGYWHSYSSYDLSTNARGMYVISNRGTTWSPWVAYNKGLWWQYRSSACSAVKSLCGRWYC